MALAMLGFGVYPIIDKGIQKLTQDPDAKKLRRGPMAIPSWIYDYMGGDKQASDVISNVLTLAPVLKEGVQQFYSKDDWFTGKPIAPARNPVRAGAQRAEHAAGALVNPYGVASKLAAPGEDERSRKRTLFDALVGNKNTSERSIRGQQQAPKYRRRDERSRERHPQGMIDRFSSWFGSE